MRLTHMLIFYVAVLRQVFVLVIFPHQHGYGVPQGWVPEQFFYLRGQGC